ncbi:MAG TPA: hypothetical protein EYO89_00705 [Candidatus Dadabacteria bacterium]|nr:hypothetical protein [Candidatus Dadabacteria bacterium]
MDHKSINKFDLRLRDRFLKEEIITVDQVNKNNESLEDQSENMEEIMTDGESSEVDDQIAE